MRNTNNNNDFGVIVQIIVWGMLILSAYSQIFCRY